MLSNKIEPNLDIFSNLLCACISDKKLGFKYAVNVWQLCLKANLKPNLTMYNLLLKATSDCNFGGITTSNSIKSKNQSDLNSKLLLENNKNEEQLIISNEDILQITPDQVHVIEDLQVIGKSINKQVDDLEWWQDIQKNIDKNELLNEMSKYRPDLNQLAKVSQFKSVLTHKDFSKNLNDHIKIDSAVNRFQALCSLDEFINSLKHHKIDPDFKTFNMILQVNNFDFILIKNYNNYDFYFFSYCLMI
jgi:hypothetical protein